MALAVATLWWLRVGGSAEEEVDEVESPGEQVAQAGLPVVSGQYKGP